MKSLRSMGLTVEPQPYGFRLGEGAAAPHVQVTVDEQSLVEYLSNDLESGEFLFPDVAPIQGAYQLLLANIEEYVTAWGTSLLRLDLNPDELVVHREPVDPHDLGLLQDDDPDAEYAWVAEPPSP